MRRMKRILPIVLAMLLLLGAAALTGCEKPAPGPQETEPQAYADKLAQGYTIVRPELATETEKAAVSELYQALNTSVLPITDMTAATGKEILLGETTREASAAAMAELRAGSGYNPSDYMIKVNEDSIVVASESESGTAAGVKYFIETILPGTEEQFPVGYTYTYRIAPAEEGQVPKKYGDKYLVWNDEFDSFDKDMWRLHRGGTSNEEYSETDEYGIKDGVAFMNEPHRNHGSFQPYLATIGTFCYNYGYLEMRAKFPILGNTSALWLYTQSNLKSENYHIEVDTHEATKATGFTSGIWKSWYYITNRDGAKDVMYKSNDNVGEVIIPDTVAFGEEWHIFGFGWDEEKMWTTLDGNVIWTLDITEEHSWGDYEGVEGLHEPMFILLSNMWKDSEHDYIADAPEGTVASFQVDYIRLYQSAYEGRAIWDAGVENWDRTYTVDMSEVKTQVDWEAVIKAADGE